VTDPTRTTLVEPRLIVRPDRRLIRASGRSRRYLLIDVTAPTVERDPARRRPPVNLAFVLDRSGSMGGQRKLPLAKQAALEAIHRLDAADRFAIVTYDTRVDVVMPGTLATPEARREAARRLEPVAPGGSTDLHAGWLTGCEQVAAGLSADGVNRVLLLTDGLANHGVIDHGTLASTAYDLRRRGVTTSTFGVGTDFDESLLQAMADSGGGHFYFAGDVAAMRDHITSEVGETLDTVAREVVVELRLPESVRVEPLSPFRVEQGPGFARIHLGDLVSGQLLTIALRLTFDYGDLGREVGAVIRIDDRDRIFELAGPGGAPVSVAWRYADHPANDAQPRDVEVDRVVARLYAERAKQEAVRLNRLGRYEDARGALDGVRRQVEQYADGDAVLRAIVGELGDAEATFAAPMPELARKSAHFASSTASRMRTVDGRSLRR
jgi:Ca-activated chloride channel family protein